MHSSEIFRFYVLAEKSFNRATLIEAELVRATHNDIKPKVENMPYAPLFLVPISFMIIWAIGSTTGYPD